MSRAKKNLGFPRFFLIRLELSLFAAVDVENQLAGQFIQSGVCHQLCLLPKYF